MPDVFILLFVLMLALMIIGMFAVEQWKHYHIRRTGRLVQARVIQVNYQQDTITPNVSLQASTAPLIGGRWGYELLAEWTDPETEQTFTLASGRKRGLPRYQRGDLLAAYVSPNGNYLVL